MEISPEGVCVASRGQNRASSRQREDCWHCPMIRSSADLVYQIQVAWEPGAGAGARAYLDNFIGEEVHNNQTPISREREEVKKPSRDLRSPLI